ncbi:MAG TPA: DNA recombination protein RmuC [Rectinemataceae bacterium]|nr:DNA recombination protein RmuC [Rectinemataceae bacterium]
MIEILSLLSLVCIIVLVILAIIILLSVRKQGANPASELFKALLSGNEKVNADNLRAETRGIRQELQDALAQTRKELGEGMDRLRGGSAETQLAFQKAIQERMDKYSETLTSNSDRISSVLQENRKELVDTLQIRLEGLQKATAEAAEKQTAAMVDVRTKVTESVGLGLKDIQEKNELKLEQMRLTVDEKLQKTLDTRLTQSFELVTKQLLEVQKGLTEMQTLAQDVGGLKKALTNVKVRGMLGEAQLGALLEQFLTPDQYAENVAVKPRSAERVEFAVKLPGVEAGEPLWLPIDSKFPIEDYQRLQDAYENGDKPAWEAAGKAFENRLYQHAVDISSKYIDVPHTTEFGLMFLPFESLYGEAIRRPGLFQGIQAKYHVTIVGPTTLAAFLNSLQVGFKTLAITKQSGEVWKVLGAIKTEFQRFGDAVSKVEKNLETASTNLSAVSHRAKQMSRKLNTVSALPSEEAMRLLPAGEAVSDEGEDDESQ